MPTFPSYAVAVFEGFSTRTESGVIRTEMESGPPKAAQVRSKLMQTRTLTYWLKSKADYGIFKTWFKTVVRYGADWFDWTDPVDGMVKQARIVSIDSETPLNQTLNDWHLVIQIEAWDG